jgi:hypothetical protein
MLMRVKLFAKGSSEPVSEFIVDESSQKTKITVEPGIIEFNNVLGARVLTNMDFVAEQIIEVE